MFKPGSTKDKAFKMALKGAKIKDIKHLCEKEDVPFKGVLASLKAESWYKGTFTWKVKADDKTIRILNLTSH